MRMLKAAAVSALLMFGAAQSFAAPTSFVATTYIGQSTSLPGVRVVFPTSASGDTVSFLVNMQRVVSWNTAGNTTGAPYLVMFTALGAQAAGDSIKVQIDVGARPLNYTPGWLNIIAAANVNFHVGGNLTISGVANANPVKYSNVISSTLLPGPYWRVRLVTLAAITAGTQYEMRFPRQSSSVQSNN